jgi:hypothetical protein
VAQHYRPGEIVPQSGVYTITHDPVHADMPHEVTVIKAGASRPAGIAKASGSSSPRKARLRDRAFRSGLCAGAVTASRFRPKGSPRAVVHSPRGRNRSGGAIGAEAPEVVDARRQLPVRAVRRSQADRPPLTLPPPPFSRCCGPRTRVFEAQPGTTKWRTMYHLLKSYLSPGITIISNMTRTGR